jgi:hypothetical protein
MWHWSKECIVGTRMKTGRPLCEIITEKMGVLTYCGNSTGSQVLFLVVLGIKPRT